MTHSKLEVANFIQSEWMKDYFRFDDVAADFEVLDFQQSSNSLCVQCRFVGDETKKGNDDDILVMMRFDPSKYAGVFPRQLQIITLEEKYTWPDSGACAALADGYIEDDVSVLNVEYVEWDDPRLSDEAVDDILNKHDHDAIADTLINKYSAKIKMPDFVPNRLRAHFSKIINDFKRI